MRWRAAIVAALMAACSDARYIASEPWTVAPDLRIALVRHETDDTVVALGAQQAFDITLAPDGVQGTDIWLLSFSQESLVAAFPGLAGVAIDALPAMLSPTADMTLGVPAPDADEILFARIGPQTSSSPQFSRRTIAELKTAGWKVRFQVPPSAFCGGYTVESWPAPAGIRLDAIAAPDEDHPVFLASTRPLAASATVSLQRFDGMGFAPIGTATAARLFVSEKLAFDPTTETLWTADSGTPIHIDLTGRAIRVPPLPLTNGFSPFVYEVSVGLDGTVMALARATAMHGGMEVSTRSPYVLEGGAWRLAFRTSDVPATPFELLEVVTARRAAAWTLCWISTYLEADQTSGWHIEFVDRGCEARSVPTTVRDVSGDREQFVVVGREGVVSFRDEDNRVWPQPDEEGSGSPGIGIPDLNVALALGEGRAIVAGDMGTILYRTNGAWCSIDAGTTGSIYRGARTPTFGSAYLLADDPARRDASILIRVKLP